VPFRERLRRPGWKILGVLILVTIVGTAPRWGAELLSRLDFFRVRHVQVRGTQYLPAEEVAMRLAADTTMSIWNDLAPLRERVLGHPQIADARIGRRLPATLVVTVEENLPVALVSGPGGLQPYDSAGRALPIDPARALLDLPVIYAPDAELLRALGRIAAEQPAFYDRINTVRRDGEGAMIVELDSIRVRAQLGVSGSRLSDIFPVESDLARRGARAAELDLRYRDQVIVRLQ
jgi:cell division septal protein FtsQ